MLKLVRTIHTIVWAFFVSMILLVPILAWLGHFIWSAAAGGMVMLEGLILLFNKGHCPLTDVAAKYTDDRRANFDIYLPEWLAKYNKSIFTTLFVIGVGIAVWRWFVR